MKTALTDNEYMRYGKQMLLTDIAEAGQLALMNARVVIVGAGGLGHLVAQYLAASGVGRIDIFDGDSVALSNLPRQLLYQDVDIGLNKAEVAESKLNQREQRQVIFAHNQFISIENYSHKLKHLEPDIVFDCSDNFDTRQLINRFAVESQTPLISAAISADDGQWFVYWPKQNHSNSSNKHGCYHCLYPADTVIENRCSTSGVLGPAVGVMASLQALAGINMLTHRDVDYGMLHRFNGKSFHWSKAKIAIDSQCRVCQQAKF